VNIFRRFAEQVNCVVHAARFIRQTFMLACGYVGRETKHAASTVLDCPVCYGTGKSALNRCRCPPVRRRWTDSCDWSHLCPLSLL